METPSMTDDEAVAELTRMYDMITKELIPQLRKRRGWKQSEKIMTISRQSWRALALKKAIEKFTDGGTDATVRSFPRRQKSR